MCKVVVIDRDLAIRAVEGYCTFIIGDIMDSSRTISPIETCAHIIIVSMMEDYEIGVDDLWVDDAEQVQMVCRTFAKTMFDHQKECIDFVLGLRD